MRSHTRTFILIAACFLWAGLIIGISFIESPAKFNAPGMTLSLGLGIERLVFSLVNKVEIALCTILLVAMCFNGTTKREWVLAGVLTGVLFLQTNWLLHTLDVQAVVVGTGQNPEPNSLHSLYQALEFVKTILLFILAFLAHKLTIIHKHADRLKAHRLQELVS
ncbi:hypothetical protein [Rufibacter sp. DG15C]|uniref:hypothetical protein n=1 Tax=Rufibacter sp. DG15C TaxID=1379909 RepID=UPI00082D235B|nr:hypothetical protein [Rufibacter sp. DG15C]